jgi:hypothetical protein
LVLFWQIANGFMARAGSESSEIQPKPEPFRFLPPALC